MPKKSLERGEARVQFLANKAEISDLLKHGYTIKAIYNKFRKAKKITMSYPSLTSHLRKETYSTTQEEKHLKSKTVPVDKHSNKNILKASRSNVDDNVFRNIEMSYEDKY